MSPRTDSGGSGLTRKPTAEECFYGGVWGFGMAYPKRGAAKEDAHAHRFEGLRGSNLRGRATRPLDVVAA